MDETIIWSLTVENRANYVNNNYVIGIFFKPCLYTFYIVVR